MCEHVFSGCARGVSALFVRGSGGLEEGRCRGYWHIFGFHICHPILFHFFIIAPLHLVVDDVL